MIYISRFDTISVFDKRKQMLVRMWRKWNAYALLVGMVTMENSREVPQKIKIELSYDPVILLLGMYLKEMKILC